MNRRYAVLDGMRGFAALMVLIFHITLPHAVVPNAYLAVDFFFMLSGFVVAAAYQDRLAGGMSALEFMQIRLTRLYPLIALGVTAGLILLAGAAVLRGTTSLPLVAGAGVLGLLLWPCPLFPQWDTAFPLNQASWSLHFELFVNAVYALIAPKLTTPRLITLTLAAAALLVITALVSGTGIAVGYDRNNFTLGYGRVMFPFFAGVLIHRWQPTVSLKPWLALMAIGELTLLLALQVAPGPAIELGYVLLAFPALLAVGAAAEAGPRLTRICVIAGQLSFPVYILQGPVLQFCQTLAKNWALSPVQKALVGTGEAALCLAVAFAALKLFDEPVRAALRKVQNRSRTRA